MRLPNKRIIERNHHSQLRFSKRELARLPKELDMMIDDISLRFRRMRDAVSLVQKHSQLFSE